MFDGAGSHESATRCAFNKANLQEVWLVEVFDSGSFVASEGGDGVEADGAIFVISIHGGEHVAVGRVKAEVVNLKELERGLGATYINLGAAMHFGVVANAL